LAGTAEIGDDAAANDLEAARLRAIEISRQRNAFGCSTNATMKTWRGKSDIDSTASVSARSALRDQRYLPGGPEKRPAEGTLRRGRRGDCAPCIGAATRFLHNVTMLACRNGAQPISKNSPSEAVPLAR
jgi:hypothetical protein